MNFKKIGHWLVSIGIVTIGWILFSIIMKLGFADFKFNLYAIGAGIVLGIFFDWARDYGKKHGV